jgi:predicted RNase H-like HicB family nuclease
LKIEIFNFKILLSNEENMWVATCLELDLVAVAATVEEVMLDISDVIFVQLQYSLENDNLDYLYKPALLEEWKLFFNSSKKETDIYFKEMIVMGEVELGVELRLEKRFA